MFNIEQEYGLVRRSDKGEIVESVPIDKAHKAYGCMKWEDIWAAAEFITVCDQIGK